MFLVFYIVCVIWSIILIRKINKDTLKGGDELELMPNLIASLIAIAPIANTLGCLVVTCFFIDEWIKHHDKTKVSNFLRKIFLISKPKE